MFKNKRTSIYTFTCLIIFLTAFLVICITIPVKVYGEVKVAEDQMHKESLLTEEQIIEEQARTDEVKFIEDKLRTNMNEDFNEILPGYDPKNLIKNAAKGDFKFDMSGVFERILNFLLREIYENIDLLIKLVVLVIVCAILKNLQASFMSKSVGELAFYVCYIVMVSVLMVSFRSALKVGMEIIDSMVNFMYASIPVLITLLISGGNITSGGAMQPLLIMIVQFTATIIKNVFIPILVLSTILTIVDNVSEKVQVARLAAFLKHLATWGLGFVLTIFVAVVSIQGSLGAVVDGITSKTTKFAISACIPVAGKYLADAADAVIGCTLLIKNGVGVAIMLGIISISLIPILKMFAIIVMYRLVCVLLEPIAEGRILKCIGEVAGSMTYILGIVASVTFMFLITVTALVTSSNLSAMMR